MLASINPLVERGRHSRYWITATTYVVGSVAGGAVTGLVAGSLGALLARAVTVGDTAVAVIVAALGVVALTFEVTRRRVPSIHRQVDEAWLEEYRGWVYGLGFGFQLGLGVSTIVTTAALYLCFAIAFLSGSVLAGLAIGLVFGLVRSLPLLTVSRVRDPHALRRHLARFSAWAVPASRITAAVLASTAIVALVSATTGGGSWPS